MNKYNETNENGMRLGWCLFMGSMLFTVCAVTIFAAIA